MTNLQPNNAMPKERYVLGKAPQKSFAHRCLLWFDFICTTVYRGRKHGTGSGINIPVSKSNLMKSLPVILKMFTSRYYVKTSRTQITYNGHTV